MGIMDKAKQALRGRSQTVEKGIDKAVEAANKRTKGKYGDKLSSTAQNLKQQARKLDEERAPGPMGGTATDPDGGTTSGPATGPTGGPTTGGPATGPSGGTTTGPVEPPERRPSGGTDVPPSGQPGL